MGRKLNQDEQDQVIGIAMQVDVAVYSPRDTWIRKYKREPTIQELAEYIAEIRLIEAKAIFNQTAESELDDAH